MSGDLVDTTEMYLKAVYELEEADIVPMRARITERLQHSGPTVSQTVGRLERDGLLELDAERRIHFTEEGRHLATRVMRKHRLVERHLVDHLELPLALVHDEACRWEHVVSEDVERRIAERLEGPYLDPFGNPIPGLAELLPEAARDPRGTEGKGSTSETLSALEASDSARAAGGTVRARLLRIGEPAQAEPGLLEALEAEGIGIGDELEVRESLHGVALMKPGGGRLVISADGATHIVMALIEARAAAM